ncbi:uncharacterized protein [Littorina saxatilis]|uniref:Uncharacterized protein n=1 Tax=Littorina saxatilis TaxID=31220 RepID=A0AAN9GRT8_9CAEN
MTSAAHLLLLLVVIVPATLGQGCDNTVVDACTADLEKTIEPVRALGSNIFVICRVFRNYYKCVEGACGNRITKTKNGTVHDVMARYGYECVLDHAAAFVNLPSLFRVATAIVLFFALRNCLVSS